MNYRHVFHAGNFADLIKHAVLTHLLDALTAELGALTVIDTHAGAGIYDLAGEEARRTGEGAAGIGRLMADDAAPAAFAGLRAAVAAVNGGGGLRRYPGSPLIIAGALRPGDRLIACELRADDHAALARALARRAGIEALNADGWQTAPARAPAAAMRLLVLIDPPYEKRDDGARAPALCADLLGRNRGAVIAIWAPIKDLASFDALLVRLRDAAGAAPILLTEVRLRPLDDPTALNGCALMVINPPERIEAPAAEAAAWVARALGEAGATGRTSRL